jgi:effector-binding domain-containing protein
LIGTSSEGSKVKSILALVAVVVTGLILSLLFRLGSFKPVQISESDRPAMKIVYKHHVGAYHKIVPVIEDVEKWVKANGEKCELSFGEYLDNPDEVAEDRLRSNGGCIVEAKPNAQMPDGFKFREVPPHHFVVGEFDGAPSIGPMKVYPKAKDSIASKGYQISGPIFELYKIGENQQVKTTYLFPVVKAGEKDPNPIAER